MARPSARQILAELLPVLLVLVCLGGGLALVIATHRRFPPQPEPVAPPKPAPVPPPVVEIPHPEPDPKPVPEPQPDPTEPILAKISRQIDDERAKAKAAEEKVQTSEKAIATARSEVEKLNQEESLLKSRAAELDRHADLLEREAALLAKHRDVLAQKRDEQAQELDRLKSRSKDSYAVLPYRGENGTWRRPIAIECRDGSAKLQPDGRTYSMLELAGGLGLSLRASPLVTDVAREIIKASGETPPDGSRVVPYILFVIRPDGVRAYYEARAQLERLGIAFGYELVGDDMAIDYPSADDPTRWSDGEPARGDVLARAEAGPSDNPYVWPQAPPPTPQPGLSASDLDLLNALDRPSGELGSSGRPGPFPTVPDGPPINYVPDPRPLARINGQSGEGGMASGSVAPGSGRSGSGLGVLPTASTGGYGSSSVSDSGRGRSPVGLGADGLGLQPVPSVPGAERGLDRGSGLSPNRTSDVAGGGGRKGQAGPRTGPFPNAPPGGFSGGTEGEEGVENRGIGGISGTEGGNFASNGGQGQGRRPGPAPMPGRVGMGPSRDGSGPSGRVASGASSSSATEGRQGMGQSRGGSGRSGRVASGPPSRAGRAGGLGTPSEVTALGGSSGVNPLGAVIARALASGSGLGAGEGQGQDEASDSSRFLEQLAEANAGGRGGRGQGSGSEGSGSQGQGQSSEPGGAASSASAGGSSGGSSGSAAPGMVSTTLPHPKPWMNDKSLPITLACGPNGVLVQPGGYRLSRGALEKSHLLHDRLKAVVKGAEKSAHGQPVKPRLQFVIEPGGEETFWLVRRQTVFAGTDWPATVRLVESGGLDVFSGRQRR